jgi:hypothetical protein
MSGFLLQFGGCMLSCLFGGLDLCLGYFMGSIGLMLIYFQVFQFLLLVVILQILNTCLFVSLKCLIFLTKQHNTTTIFSCTFCDPTDFVLFTFEVSRRYVIRMITLGVVYSSVEQTCVAQGLPESLQTLCGLQTYC